MIEADDDVLGDAIDQGAFVQTVFPGPHDAQRAPDKTDDQRNDICPMVLEQVSQDMRKDHHADERSGSKHAADLDQVHLFHVVES